MSYHICVPRCPICAALAVEVVTSVALSSDFIRPRVGDEGVHVKLRALDDAQSGHVTSAHNAARARAFDWADSEGTVDVDEWGPLAIFCVCWVTCVVVLLGLAVWAAVVNWGNA